MTSESSSNNTDNHNQQMRERLKEAIAGWNGYLTSCRARGVDETQLRLVLAAARAYSCSECGGTGLCSKSMPIGEDYRSVCPTCKADRQLADS
jgi:DnaJ-class molecular chaperone